MQVGDSRTLQDKWRAMLQSVVVLAVSERKSVCNFQQSTCNLSFPMQSIIRICLQTALY